MTPTLILTKAIQLGKKSIKRGYEERGGRERIKGAEVAEWAAQRIKCP